MLNHRRLRCFRVLTKEGGSARAAERLGMAVQTIGAQMRELEKARPSAAQAFGPRCGPH